MFIDYGQKNIFLGIISSFRQLLFTFFRLVVWLSWNFVRFHKIHFKTDAESFSFLSWKTKKFYFKKNNFLAVVNIKTKKLCLLTQFSGKVLVMMIHAPLFLPSKSIVPDPSSSTSSMMSCSSSFPKLGSSSSKMLLSVSIVR